MLAEEEAEKRVRNVNDRPTQAKIFLRERRIEKEMREKRAFVSIFRDFFMFSVEKKKSHNLLHVFLERNKYFMHSLFGVSKHSSSSNRVMNCQGCNGKVYDLIE
jgi:hypothetical protein